MVKHISALALWIVWTGREAEDYEDNLDIGLAIAACTNRREPDDDLTDANHVLKEIPTCPRCAVLFDQAIAAREEELGRRAAA